VIPSKWFTVPVSVRPYLGSGSFGATLGDPVALLGNVDQRRRLVRDAGGFEVAAEMTVRIPPTTAAIPGHVGGVRSRICGYCCWSHG
jgi:hypothetical protein